MKTHLSNVIVFVVFLYWALSPNVKGAGNDPPCRTGKLLFERQHVPWVRHCAVAFKDCPTPHFCMAKITPADVINAIFSAVNHKKF